MPKESALPEAYGAEHVSPTLDYTAYVAVEFMDPEVDEDAYCMRLGVMGDYGSVDLAWFYYPTSYAAIEEAKKLTDCASVMRKIAEHVS